MMLPRLRGRFVFERERDLEERIGSFDPDIRLTCSRHFQVSIPKMGNAGKVGLAHASGLTGLRPAQLRMKVNGMRGAV
jgi:hypothetical protein